MSQDNSNIGESTAAFSKIEESSIISSSGLELNSDQMKNSEIQTPGNSSDIQQSGIKEETKVPEQDKDSESDELIEEESEKSNGDIEEFQLEVTSSQLKKQTDKPPEIDVQEDDQIIQDEDLAEVEQFNEIQNADEDEDDLIERSDSEIEDEDEKEKMEEIYQEKKAEKQKSQNHRLVLRDYQNILFKNSKNKNSIIYLPTGSGKTMVSIASMYYYLCREGQGKKIVFLANTIQLVKQQTESIKKNLIKIIQNPDLADGLRGERKERTIPIKWTKDQIKNKVCCIHGEKNEEIGVTKRKKIQSQLTAKKQIINMFKKGTIFVMIAQMFLNSLRRGYIKITDFSFIVLDECHHCSGDHPYSSIMKEFYFDRPKADTNLSLYDNAQKLPIIMGLTASPVAQPFNNKDKLISSLNDLCNNLDSKFTFYETDKIRNETSIKIVKIQEKPEKQLYPQLLEHFEKFRDHKQAYDKIKFHFPIYFQCVKAVLDYMAQEYEVELSLETNPRSISSVQLLLFYDVKQCLLVKLRDILLELGEYAFTLAYSELLGQLHKINLKGDRNKANLAEIIKVLKHYAVVFNQKYGRCEKQFFSSKVIKLIQILQTGDLDVDNNMAQHKDHSNDMVLVFAAKRRTVKYIEEILKNYKNTLPEEKRKSFECRGVTGYSSKTFSNYNKNEMIYESDPSSERLFADIQFKYAEHIKKVQDQNRLIDKKNKGESENLTNQMKKMRNVKCGKLLLEVEEKYSHQINKINDFRSKKFRVLITTSVTEEGFDIPECNIVISFDKPNSLKSYIQIKGRARKKDSKYFIFTDEINYEKMQEDRQTFDDTIKITFDIAINKFSRKEDSNGSELVEKSHKFEPDPGYRKSRIKETGAILNTNYSLQILKIYCSSLRQPNKPMFYFIETPNIAFRCLIYFPPTSTTNKPYIVGDPQSSKVRALKSASYRAVIYLYKQGYIKTDLRPKKYEELEDEREIQRFEDLAETKKNEEYRQIFQQDVRVNIEDVQNESHTFRKFMRFYFRSITNAELDFPKINPEFQKFLPYFSQQKFSFQIFMMKFSNNQNLSILQSSNNNQQIGILTCYSREHTGNLFSNYAYNFQENQNESFHLKTVQQDYKINKEEYEKLKRIHLFLIAGVHNREHQYYCNKTGTPPSKAGWMGIIKKFRGEIQEDKSRQYYPLLVLLKKKNDGYVIDEVCNRKIEYHEKIFAELYRYHNIPSKTQTINKFSEDLSENIKEIQAQLQATQNYGNILIQSIQRQFCFHKCLINNKFEYSEEIDKQKSKKQTIKSRHLKLTKMFKHSKDKIKEVIKITLWRKFKKDKKSQLFQRDVTLITKDIENPRLYLIDQFVMYPLTPSQLFKASLAAQFLFKAYYQFSLALAFKNIQLGNIINQKIKQSVKQKPFVWQGYPSLILQNQKQVFKHLYDNGSSNYLRGIGKDYNQKSRFIAPFFELSLSRINQNQMSMISKNNRSLNDSNMSDFLPNNITDLNNSSFLNDSKSSIKQQPQEIVSDGLVSEIKVTEILKVLTSRMYKFSKYDNYEEYQFIGDVVLKLLSTIQVYLQKPKAEQSQMHIRRANIICNANLHRKAILKRIYKYILTKKYVQHPPPYEFVKPQETNEQYYEDTKIRKFEKNSLIQGFHYIPGKVHADVVEALIGAFYLKRRSLEDCQILLYSLDILKKPNLKVIFKHQNHSVNELPQLYSDFEDRINYKFQNKGLLLQALTHSSFKSILHSVIDQNNLKNIIEQASSNLASQTSFMSNLEADNITTKVNSFQTFYERLEFLGDSILDLIVVEYLYEKYGSQDQGMLTELKQAGVSNKTLGIIAMKYGMHELILMEHPENDRVMKEFRQIHKKFNEIVEHPEKLIQMKINSIKILGDVFEALVGAIFLDLQMDYIKTKAIVFQMISELLQHYTNMQNIKNSGNYKYQEYLGMNNYKNCHIKKDTGAEIQNGMFKFLLVDRTGNIIDECWEYNEKRAYDLILEKFYEKKVFKN